MTYFGYLNYVIQETVVGNSKHMYRVSSYIAFFIIDKNNNNCQLCNILYGENNFLM
jgi:hypothetical protein